MKIKKVFAGFVFIGILAVHSALNAQTVGTMAPDFTLKELNGTDFTLSDQTGKVVFIFFFGYGCPHCHTNAKNTQKVFDNFSSNKDFVAIGIDGWDGSNKQVEDFKDLNGLTYTMLVDGSNVMSDYKTSQDRLFVIGKDGNVSYVSPGFASESAANEAIQVITGIFNTPGTTNTSSAKIVNSEDIIFFPNPAVDIIRIVNPYTSDRDARLELLDISGRIIKTTNVVFKDGKTSSIDVSELPEGWYALRLISRSGSIKTSRLIINRN
jgi:peroxiredoxin